MFNYSLLNRLLYIFQFVLVSIYIFFEEFIWELIAEPIYKQIKALKLFQKLQTFITQLNRYSTIFLFILLFLSVESCGLLAGISFLEGKISLAIIFYLLKLQFATFTFWLFRVSKDKLLTFSWFAFGYNNLLILVEKIKELDVYKRIISIFKNLKSKIASFKVWVKLEKGNFIENMKKIYSYLKNRKSK
jgi:hypothetical protein